MQIFKLKYTLKTIFPIVCFFLIALAKPMHAQIGGDNTYEFLNMTTSARVAALGGNFLAMNDGDVSLALMNPSTISKEMDRDMALSFVDFYSNINYGFASLVRSYDKLGNFATSVQYVNYGTFKYADFSGNLQGEFSASEMALVVGWGRQLTPKISIGANAKFIYSSLESYKSYGLAIDLASTYYNEANQFTASLIFKNIGRQLKSYRSGNTEPLPFEIQFGLSKKLTHIPFRYSLVITHMEKWDLTYEKPLYVQSMIGDENANDVSANFGEKFFSHIVLGGELNITDNFVLRLGYNYRRRQEMKMDARTSTVGFSWGFGCQISKFQFNYARSTYHLIGSPNYITITTNLDELLK